MTSPNAATLALVALLAAACTTAPSAGEVAAQPAAQPGERGAPPMPTTARGDEEPAASTPPADAAATLEALALRCDGSALAAGLAASDLQALRASDAPSVRLLATWEGLRAFSDDGSIDGAAVTGLADAVTAQLGQAPPRWWIEHLASARRPADGASISAYDVGLTKTGDRRGELVDGPAKTRVRPAIASVLTASDDALAYDLSAGRVELGPLPDPGSVVEVARARGASTLYVATYDLGGGGFRFPLRALTRDGQRWQAEVCGPDRTVLGGVGSMIAEIVVLHPPQPADAAPGVMRPPPPATGVAVFTAETHGAALDVFDPESGARTLAWSSELWFARRG
ncbi:MAG: hypothetical protein R3A79_26845 [Nannocystaceae bacterium]